MSMSDMGDAAIRDRAIAAIHDIQSGVSGLEQAKVVGLQHHGESQLNKAASSQNCMKTN